MIYSVFCQSLREKSFKFFFKIKQTFFGEICNNLYDFCPLGHCHFLLLSDR